MPVTSLSSAGTSTVISLDPIAKATSLSVTATLGSSAGANLTVQGTVNDFQLETVSWFDISSAIVGSSLSYLSAFYTVLSPLTGVRLNSSGFGSFSTVTLNVRQSDPV